ncbi:MAG TPA: hypothetical protein ENJ50_02335, partial [Planctomycetaceae bacterium]|nr:hypothetical protein [Planctomycetaceae bacterium]
MPIRRSAKPSMRPRRNVSIWCSFESTVRRALACGSPDPLPRSSKMRFPPKANRIPARPTTSTTGKTAPADALAARPWSKDSIRTAMPRSDETRRRLLQMGLAAAALPASWLLGGCDSSDPADDSRKQGNDTPVSPGDSSRRAADLEKWRRIRGKPYELGKLGAAPGVCQLPGPGAKRNWPDREKYKDVQTVPGMCQLCSTVCGIIGYVRDGRLLKIEGNPRDPNS